MDGQRRAALREGGVLGVLGVLLATGVLRPDAARAEWNKAAFDSKSVGETLSALGLGGAAASSAIALEAPEIAENGAVVPVKVSTELPRVDRIVVLVEKNPTMLSAVFTLPPDTEASIMTRVKMAQTSQVIVAVQSDGKVYTVSKEVKVTLGGCGG
jgi:sulfur-oxidizing protein SoxY